MQIIQHAKKEQNYVRPQPFIDPKLDVLNQIDKADQNQQGDLDHLLQLDNLLVGHLDNIHVQTKPSAHSSRQFRA